MNTTLVTSRAALIAPLAAIPGPAAGLSFPSVGKVRARVFAHFLDGRFLTRNEALRLYSTICLAAVVLVIGKMGWAIKGNVVDSPTAEGRLACIAEYVITGAAIEKAGDGSRELVRGARKFANMGPAPVSVSS